MAEDFLTAAELQEITGTPASTWRYWQMIGKGPASMKLGRRRVWKRESFESWLRDQEQQTARD